METAFWCQTSGECVPDDAQRIYLGHETSLDRFPSLQDLVNTVRRLRDAGKQLTLVTPLLTEEEMSRILEMITSISEVLNCCEVVCNDWGLLHWLVESALAIPTVGRFLVGQATDPRLADFDLAEKQLRYERCVSHADGTTVQLRYRRPTDALMTHLQSCSIASAGVLAFLQDLGVRRFEVSNLLQGIHITPVPGWHVTLHLPEVPVAIARHCWRDSGSRWFHSSFPLGLCQRDNVVFYRNERIPCHIESLGIDRLVHQL